jgi:GGDEF domain-containing protein
VITLLATALKAAGEEVQGPQPFIGHVGGDDFVIICMPEQVEPLTTRALEVFDHGVVALHDREDAERGYLLLTDRRGNEVRFPLVSVSIGVATNDRRAYRDHREIVTVATEMKKVAKGMPGSAVAVDRRSDSEQAEGDEETDRPA